LTGEVKLVSKESAGKQVTAHKCDPVHGERIYPRIVVDDEVAEHWRSINRPNRLNGHDNVYYVDIREELITYHAAQLVLHSSPMLHHPPMADDRSAVTFWLPRSKTRCEEIAKAFERIAEIFRTAGHD
jgi:hypothetical protein